MPGGRLYHQSIEEAVQRSQLQMVYPKDQIYCTFCLRNVHLHVLERVYVLGLFKLEI